MLGIYFKGKVLFILDGNTRFRLFECSVALFNALNESNKELNIFRTYLSLFTCCTFTELLSVSEDIQDKLKNMNLTD